jgi:ketosteroid isomerase-like protein
MKNTFMVIPLVLLCCFIVGCQQRREVAEEPAADVGADIQAIKDMIVETESAVNAGDTDRVMAMVADDIVTIRPNEPALIGKKANRNRTQQEFDELELQDVYEIKDIHISGDLAVAHFLWSTKLKIKANGKSGETNGNWITVAERQPDGAWKCIYSIWSDEGLVRPTQAE